MNYNECVEYILNIPKFSKIKSQDRCSEILSFLGNPEKKLKVVHVAGTNGKGSTCAFANSILMAMNKSVGLFTSPHLVKINERIKINGVDISDEEFLNVFQILDNALLTLYNKEYIPTFFEYIFLLAVIAFNRANVEYAVLEVGMGGRLDATNIIAKPVVSIITSVSMDHMEILGNTLEKIATEKAGIIKKEVPVVYYGEDKCVSDVIEKAIEEKKSKCIKVTKSDIVYCYENDEKNHKSIDFSYSNMYDRYGVLKIPFVMEYQAINATLAIRAMEMIFDSDLDISCIKTGLMNTVWQGRMEEIADNVYLDGAHNYEGITEFVKYVNQISKYNKVYILFSVVKEKEYIDMMNLIASIDNCNGYYVAPVNSVRALVAKDMKDYLEQFVDVPVYQFDSIDEAYKNALRNKKKDEVLFCTGSLYMVGEVKEAVNKHR